MSATHIVFVSANPVWGGSEQLWKQTALNLTREGHRVTAVVTNALVAHREILDLQRSGVDVRTHTLPPSRWRRLRRKFSPGQSHIALDFREVLPTVKPTLVVLSTGACLMPIEFIDLCITNSWPFVTIGQANFEGWWPDDDAARRYRDALPRALRCYFVSSGNLRLAEKQLGYEIENGEVVWNPYNVSYDAAPAWPHLGENTKLHLACVARLHPQSKGQDILLEALAHPNWVARRWGLTLYGDWAWRNSLERLAARLGLEERVGFAGYEPNVEAIWAENHVLVMPSRFEGLPLAMVEALLCGRPVVATDVAGHKEIVEEGVSGFIADAPTSSSFGLALERLWAQRNDLENMGKTAARRIREKVPRDPIGEFSEKIKGLCKV
jgi:glycosyltransferase involved in cell wall biosynthesis